MRALLEADVQARSKVTGVGYAWNIAGMGTDDARDAVDRRVEFRVIPCTELKKQAAAAPIEAAPGV